MVRSTTSVSGAASAGKVSGGSTGAEVASGVDSGAVSSGSVGSVVSVSVGGGFVPPVVGAVVAGAASELLSSSLPHDDVMLASRAIANRHGSAFFFLIIMQSLSV